MRLATDQRGVAAVEFALTGTLMFAMLGAVVDFGLAIGAKGRLANAVADGIQYAVLNASNGVTTGQIQTIVQNSSLLPHVTATVTGPACYCVTGSTPSLTAAVCGANCADGTTAGSYVSISATYPYTAFMPAFSTLAGTTTLTEAATVRIQ
jgi:Flp pilus assembly protein TadG